MLIYIRILSPVNDTQFVLTGETGGDRVQLESSVDGGSSVHWFLNGKYLGDGEPGAPRYLPLTAGAHKLACMSENGVVDSVQFTVARPSARPRFAVQ